MLKIIFCFLNFKKRIFEQREPEVNFTGNYVTRGLIDSLKLKDPGLRGNAYAIKKENIVVVLSFYGTFLKGNLEFIRNLDWEHLET